MSGDPGIQWADDAGVDLDLKASGCSAVRVFVNRSSKQRQIHTILKHEHHKTP